MLVMLQCYSFIFDRYISAPGNGKEVADVINAIYNWYIYQLTSNVQLHGLKLFDHQMQVHTSTQNNDVSLDK